MNRYRILVTCAKGITPYLAGEVRDMGCTVLTESLSGVETEGTVADAMRLNLHLRTGHRVLLFLRDFPARDIQEFYREINLIPWEEYIDANGYFSVTSSVDTPLVTDSRFANVKCKDAIADRFREKLAKRPDSGSDRSRVVIHLYWKNVRCSIYLDTSGEPLSKRNYRKIPLTAPMQETLAAAVIMATKWDRKSTFINPMCGSGTLAIEAALIALNRPPGLLRENFAFMHLKGFNRELWDTYRQGAKKSICASLDFRIIATDRDPAAIEASRKNAAAAGVEQFITFDTCDFRDTDIPESSGIVIINPEYGERMGTMGELTETYKGIEDFFKQKCREYTGYIFTGNFELAKKVGLRTKRRMPFFSGGMECRLLEYELYEGSRKS